MTRWPTDPWAPMPARPRRCRCAARAAGLTSAAVLLVALTVFSWWATSVSVS